MQKGTVQKTIALFKDALLELQADISLIQLEDLAIVVHKAMTVQARYFHTPEHIFDLADASNPIQALAALYHDVVYYQIDQGFIPEIEALIAPYLEEKNRQLHIIADPPPDDLGFTLALETFAFEPGQTLPPFGGQNEFLSALTMTKTLEGVIAETDLLKIAACIEATIPFRGRNAQGEIPADVLRQRLDAINTRHGYGMSPEEIDRAIEWAVVISNRDVASFAEEDTARFLDGTWNLLPETNPSLRLRGIYSIKSYRLALQNMLAFMDSLDPDVIFYRYKTAPPKAVFDRMVALAHTNVYTAREYLAIKLLTAAVLEALADLTGGDAPIALFMGDIGPDDENATQIENLLPTDPASDGVDTTSVVYRLLAEGRASHSSFDLKNSPLALFIYKQLSLGRIRQLLELAKRMFDGKLYPAAFLDQLPTPMITAIATACAVQASTRNEALREYAAYRQSQQP